MGDSLSVSFNDLKPKQKQVVKYEGGPLLVLAGPGTGKTEVLTHRVAYLISQKKVSPKEILAITFTKKAANEMLERLKEFEGLKTFQPSVSTLHAESLNVLGEIGQPSFEFIADDDETLMLMKDASEDLNLEIGYRELKTLKRRIELLKANNRLPNEMDENGSDVMLKRLYERYELLLTYNKATDLGGLVVKAVRSIFKNYRPNVRQLLVDEYQDINRVEYRLIQLLARDADGLFVVGDDDQSIYGWRGADPSIIWDFENTFKGAKIESLEDSIRCPEHILKGALGVVSKCSNYKHKSIHSARGEGSKIHILRSSSEIAEARCILRKALYTTLYLS
jgi:DNA helicase-2/ATP-dependent DNA helicase PcrA